MEALTISAPGLTESTLSMASIRVGASTKTVSKSGAPNGPDSASPAVAMSTTKAATYSLTFRKPLIRAFAFTTLPSMLRVGE